MSDTAIFDGNSDPKGEIDAMTDGDHEAIESQLLVFYEAGKQATDLGKAIIQGFRKGQFATDSDGAFSLVAFLHGSDSNAKFNLLNIFASVKE